MMIFGGLFWLLLLGIGVAGAVWLFGAARRRGSDMPMAERNSPALEILEQRYARGEISREEYLGKRSDMLRSGGDAPAP